MRVIFILLICFPLNSYSQFSDSFNDGDFKVKPQWMGNDELFIVNTNNELQLNDVNAGTAYMATESAIVQDATWQFKLRMDFNPSSSNYVRIYLISDSNTLIDADNAVYIEAGSADDNICLYKVSDGTTELIIKGATDRLDLQTVEVNIKVSRNNDDWHLESNTGSGWFNEGTANFLFNHPSNYFGIFCEYTKTRANKFFFDDFAVEGDAYTDKDPPMLTNFKLINGSTIALYFNEPLDESSISTDDFLLQQHQQNASSFHYNSEENSIRLWFSPNLNNVIDETLIISQINDLYGNTIIERQWTFSYERVQLKEAKLLSPALLYLNFSKVISKQGFNNAQMLINNEEAEVNTIVQTDDYSITLELSEALQKSTYHRIELSHFADVTGDVAPAYSADIIYYETKRFDLVFNEWMADPNPSVGLPELEYIELKNNTAHQLNLEQWQLLINDKTVHFPKATIEPQNFACLVSASKQDEWTEAGPTIFINGLPSLGNSGFEMILLDNNGNVVDAYQYDPSEIGGESFKKDGGWSVERIDPLNYSGESNNFYWSMNLSGGTPGFINSVNGINTDVSSPMIKSIQLSDDKELQITFSESMNFDKLIEAHITPELQLLPHRADTIFLQSLVLPFETALQLNKAFQLTNIEIEDIAGNALNLETPFYFGKADSLMRGDVLINEILFNPFTDGSDFVELYNYSDKILSLDDLYFAEVEENEIVKLHATHSSRQLMPKEYLVLTKDKTTLCQQYDCKNKYAILEISSLPSYPDDKGDVIITNKQGLPLDHLSYSSQMHFDLIKDEEGVSLERLSWQEPTNNISNWHSAASVAGYATPGYLNSQQQNEIENTNKSVTIEPEVFTPNGDGTNDWLNIRYKNDEAGATASIRIFNSQGQEVRYLLNNQILADNGFIRWDGLSDTRSALQPGIYVIFFQCVYPSGKVLEEKLSCIIGVNDIN